jgi:hypothetical protein
MLVHSVDVWEQTNQAHPTDQMLLCLKDVKEKTGIVTTVLGAEND